MAADDGYPGGWLSSGLIRMIDTAPRGSPPQVNHGIRGIGISACLIWVAALSEGCVPYGHEFVAPRPAEGVTEARLLARCDAIPSDQTRKGMHTRRLIHAHTFVLCSCGFTYIDVLDTCHRDYLGGEPKRDDGICIRADAFDICALAYARINQTRVGRS